MREFYTSLKQLDVGDEVDVRWFDGTHRRGRVVEVSKGRLTVMVGASPIEVTDARALSQDFPGDSFHRALPSARHRRRPIRCRAEQLLTPGIED